MTRSPTITVLASLLSTAAIVAAPAVAAATTDTAAATGTSHTVISADGPTTNSSEAPYDIHW